MNKTRALFTNYDMEKKTTTAAKKKPPSKTAGAKKAGSMAGKATNFCCNCVDKACKAIDKPINTPSKRERLSRKVAGGTEAVVIGLNKMTAEFNEIEQDCITKVRNFRESRAVKKAARAIKE